MTCQKCGDTMVWLVGGWRCVNKTCLSRREESARCPDCGSTFTIDEKAERVSEIEWFNKKTSQLEKRHVVEEVVVAFCNGCERVEVLGRRS